MTTKKKTSQIVNSDFDKHFAYKFQRSKIFLIKNDKAGTYLTISDGSITPQLHCRARITGGISSLSAMYTQKWRFRKTSPLESPRSGKEDRIFSISPVFQSDPEPTTFLKLMEEKKKNLNGNKIVPTKFFPGKKISDFGKWKVCQVSESERVYNIVNVNEVSCFDLDGGKKFDGNKTFSWKLNEQKRNKNQQWIFEVVVQPNRRIFVLDSDDFSLDPIAWIPSDCVFVILQFVASPLVLLLTRQVNQQFFVETKREELWRSQIKRKMTMMNFSNKKEITEDHVKTKFSFGKNLMGLFFQNFFPLSFRRYLPSNEDLAKHHDKYFEPLFFVEEVKPIGFNPSRKNVTYFSDRKEGSAVDEQTCLSCDKKYKHSENKEMNILSYTYESSEYGGGVTHVGYCSKECFNKEIIPPALDGTSNMRVTEVYDGIIDVVSSYYSRESTEGAFNKKFANAQEFFHEFTKYKESMFVYVSWGGPTLSGFYCFYGTDKEEVKNLLKDEYKKYEVGMVSIHCSARMGGSFLERIVYFLHRGS